MTSKKSAILWDMDGTIIDSKEAHFISWKAVLESHGYTMNRQIYDENFGRNTRTILPMMLGHQPDPAFLADLLEEKEALFRDVALKEAKLIAGVENWLRCAQKRQILQGIASSGSLKNINTMLSSFNLLHYFDALTSGSTLPAKPEPDVFLKAAKTLKTDPQNCLVIEDSLAGIQAAQKAGMACIAIASSHPHEALNNADLILDDFTQDPIPLLDSFIPK